jgi:hypothetical protein
MKFLAAAVMAVSVAGSSLPASLSALALQQSDMPAGFKHYRTVSVLALSGMSTSTVKSLAKNGVSGSYVDVFVDLQGYQITDGLFRFKTATQATHFYNAMLKPLSRLQASDVVGQFAHPSKAAVGQAGITVAEHPYSRKKIVIQQVAFRRGKYVVEVDTRLPSQSGTALQLARIIDGRVLQHG